MLFGKKRWICGEVEQMLLVLHPAYDIRVKIKTNGKTVDFPFRDNEGKMFVDPYCINENHQLGWWFKRAFWRCALG